MSNEQTTINWQEQKRTSYQPRLTSLEFTSDTITAFLDDGRKLTVPVVWFSRLRKATLSQLKNYRILPDGYHIHWPELDEDVSLRVFIDGLGAGCC